MSTQQYRVRRSPAKDRLGVTLMELIIVMAIVALLAAVTVPTLVKMGAFSRNDLLNAARQVYGLHRAARVYAATYRVDTAVVYALNTRTDSKTDTDSIVVDGLGMARRVTENELDDIAQDWPTRFGLAYPSNIETDRVFVMVQEPEGRFREMVRGTCLKNEAAAVNAYYSVRGLQELFVFGEQEEPTVPRQAFGDDLDPYVGSGAGELKEDYTFPAHVYTPTGVLQPIDSPYARFKMDVGPAPDAPVEDRFWLPEGATVEEEVPVIGIDIYRTTGRVKMVDR